MPTPGSLSTPRRPFSASTRSARPRRPGAERRVGAADAVVAHLDDRVAVQPLDANVRRRSRLGVLRHVRQRLGDDVVRGRLDRPTAAARPGRSRSSRAAAHGRRARRAPARGHGRSARPDGCRVRARAARRARAPAPPLRRRSAHRRPPGPTAASPARAGGRSRSRRAAAARRRAGCARASCARRRPSPRVARGTRAPRPAPRRSRSPARRARRSRRGAPRPRRGNRSAVTRETLITPQSARSTITGAARVDCVPCCRPQLARDLVDELVGRVDALRTQALDRAPAGRVADDGKLRPDLPGQRIAAAPGAGDAGPAVAVELKQVRALALEEPADLGRDGVHQRRPRRLPTRPASRRVAAIPGRCRARSARSRRDRRRARTRTGRARRGSTRSPTATVRRMPSAAQKPCPRACEPRPVAAVSAIRPRTSAASSGSVNTSQNVPPRASLVVEDPGRVLRASR